MRLGGWRLPLERLSATSLSTYVQCPEQFRRKYLLKEPERMTGERFIGSVTHQSMHALFMEKDSPDVENVVGHVWGSIIEKEGEPDWHETDAAKQYKMVKKMVETYWPIVEATTVVAAEQRFEESILGVSVVGYIDVELADRIREVKTSSRKETKPKARWSFQGRLYALVSAKPVEWHVVTRQVTPQVYVPSEETPELLQSFQSNATLMIVKHAIERMNDDYARYGSDEPWPMDGIFGDWACGYCSFRKGCPAWAKP